MRVQQPSFSRQSLVEQAEVPVLCPYLPKDNTVTTLLDKGWGKKGFINDGCHACWPLPTQCKLDWPLQGWTEIFSLSHLVAILNERWAGIFFLLILLWLFLDIKGLENEVRLTDTFPRTLWFRSLSTGQTLRPDRLRPYFIDATG